jgi:ubiquitin conjugation factor E4 B
VRQLTPDAVNIRFYIAMIFRVIWVNPSHREALHREVARVDQFVRFINLLINDTTYLMDESLSNLQQIRQIELLKANTDAWNALDEEERKDKDAKYKQAETTAKMDIGLCNETVRLLKLITEETQTPFCRPEIVDRLASMLNYNLNLLAGPTSQELRVNKMAEYKWQPKTLLADLLAIYLHLGGMPDFQAGLARDGRSYSKELFDRADRIAQRTAIKTDAELQTLRAMVNKVEALKAEADAEDEMGEVPDEFLGERCRLMPICV